MKKKPKEPAKGWMWFNFDYGKGPATLYVPARLISIRSKFAIGGQEALSDEEILYFNKHSSILKKRYARLMK